MTDSHGSQTAPRPLSGLRVVEVSSFVASPLCGLTLAQLGAEVIRVDPVGGAADVHRLPRSPEGTSIYWTGLNRGKASVTLDLRSEEGQAALRELVCAPGEGGGILVTNSGGRPWMSHDTLAAIRPDGTTGWRAKYSEPSSPCSSAPTNSSRIDRRGGSGSAAKASPISSTMATPLALSRAPL